MKFKPVIIGAAVGAGMGLTVGLLAKKPSAAPLPSPEPRPPPPEPPVEPVTYDCPKGGGPVAIIGDSYAEGLAPHLGSHARECGVPYVTDARRGSSVVQWQQSGWIEPVLAHKPAVVLISLGGNDFSRDSAMLKKAIDSVVDRIRFSGAKPLWIEPNKLPMAEQSGVRQLWKDKMGRDWFPSWELPLEKAGDGIHLYPSGYKAWAAEIWPWMSAKTHEMTAS
jgi:lysophospholipase L1-like esterase